MTGEPVGPRTRRSFRADVVESTATNLVIAGANVATGLIAARVLGPEGRGELAAIFSWPMLIAALATLGLPDAIVYFTARAKALAGTHFSTALTVALGASVVFTAVGWVAMPYVLAAQDADVVSAARWYLVSVPLAATLGMADRPLRGIGDIRSWNLMRVAPTAAWLVILLVAWVRGDGTPVSLAMAFLLARVALVGPILHFVRRRIAGAWRPERSVAAPMLRYGLPSFVSVLPTVLNQRLDQLVMAGFLPARTLGLYVVAVAWSGILTPGLLAFANVLFPRVASDEHSDEERAAVFAQGLRIGTLAAVLLGVGAAVMTPLVLPLVFGAEFRSATGPAVVLVAAMVVAGVNTIGEEGLRGLGRPGLVLRAELCGLAVTLASLSLLIGRFELMGAAVASLLGYSVVAALVVSGGRRVTGSSWRGLLVVTRSDGRLVARAVRRRRGGTPAA